MIKFFHKISLEQNLLIWSKKWIEFGKQIFYFLNFNTCMTIVPQTKMDQHACLIKFGYSEKASQILPIFQLQKY